MGLEGTHTGLMLTPGAGRRATPLLAEVVRELTPADVALLDTERGIKPRPIGELRDRHHALARVLAQGMKDAEAAAVTGYTVSRVSILKSDPAFQDLVKHYQSVQDSAHGEFIERANILALSAVTELQDRIEDDPSSVETGELVRIAQMAADRSGHAPVTRSVSTNVNIDLGQRLEAARRRMAGAKVDSAA